jgi:uncharacterized protein
MRYLFIFLIYLYRYTISPLLGNVCRFNPTCSTYALEAFKKYGTFKGLKLSLIRLSKCHPFHPGGNDFLP